MTNTNMFEANSDLSQPVKRIGGAKGKFTVPENFDEMDKDIKEMFADYL